MAAEGKRIEESYFRQVNEEAASLQKQIEVTREEEAINAAPPVPLPPLPRGQRYKVVKIPGVDNGESEVHSDVESQHGIREPASAVRKRSRQERAKVPDVDLDDATYDSESQQDFKENQLKRKQQRAGRLKPEPAAPTAIGTQARFGTILENFNAQNQQTNELKARLLELKLSQRLTAAGSTVVASKRCAGGKECASGPHCKSICSYSIGSHQKRNPNVNDLVDICAACDHIICFHKDS